MDHFSIYTSFSFPHVPPCRPMRERYIISYATRFSIWTIMKYNNNCVKGSTEGISCGRNHPSWCVSREAETEKRRSIYISRTK